MADGSVIIDTELDESGLRKGLSNLGTKALSGVNTALKATYTALAAGATAAVKFGIDFESAFAGVKKTVDATDEEIESFRTQILEMSERLPFAATEISAVAEAAGQLGIQNENLIAFTETMTNLGVATNMTADEAATSLAKFANITQMPQENFDRLGSTIVALGNNFATTESDIVRMSMRIASAGSTVGMSEAQIMALAASLSSVGMEAENGGSSISQLLSLMQVAAETGGEQLTALASVAGMTGDEFATAFKEDAGEALMSFLNGLASAEDRGQSAIGIIAELGDVAGLSSIDTRVLRDTLIRAANASELFADATELANEAWESNTALSAEAEQRYETLESKLTMLTNTAKNLGIAVSDTLQGGLKDAVDTAKSMLQELETVTKEEGLQGLVRAVGDVLADALLVVGEQLPKFAEAGIDLMNSFISGISESAPVIAQIVADIANTLIDGVISLCTGLVELGAEIIIALCNGIAGNANQLIETIVSGLTDFLTTIIEYIPSVIEAGATLVIALGTGIINAIPSLLESAGFLIEAVLRTISEGCTMLTEAISGDMLSGLTDIIANISLALPELVSSIVGGILEFVPVLVDCGIQLFVALVQAMPDIIANIVESVAVLATSIVASLLATVPSIIECGIELLTSLVAGLPQIILNVVAAIPAILAALVSALVDSIPTIIECGVNLLTSLISDLPDIIVAVVAAIPKIVAGLVQAIVGSTGQIVQAGITLLTSLITALPNIISTIVRAVPQIVAAIYQAFISLKYQLVEAGSNLLHGLAEGIGNAVGAVVARAVAAAQAVVSSVKGFFGIASPSKVFREQIGKQLMLGLAGGISQYASEAVSAAEDAAEEIEDVDFTLPDPKGKPNPYSSVNYSALEAQARMAVAATTLGTQQKLTGTTAAENAYAYGGGAGTQVNIGAVNVITDELKEDADFDRVGRKMADSFARKARVTGSLNPV